MVAGRRRRGPRRRHGWGALLLAGDRLSRDLEHHSPNRGYGDAEGTQANSPSTETGARNPRGRGSASNGGRKCSCWVWQRLARRRSHERENGEGSVTSETPRGPRRRITNRREASAGDNHDGGALGFLGEIRRRN